MTLDAGPIDTVLPPAPAVAPAHHAATGSSDPAAAALLETALAHHRAGHLPLAAMLYRNLLKRALESAIRGTVHYNLGVIAQRQHHPAAARDEYLQTLRHHPRLFLAHNNLGNVLHDLGQTEESLECFARALALQPDFAPALLNRAVALRALGRLDEALECCRNAQGIDPSLADAVYTEGNIQFDLGRPEAALVCYDRALTLRPDDANALINRGNALAELGRLQDAEDSYRQAQRLAPREPMPHSNLLFINAYTRHRPPIALRTLAEGWERSVLTAAERAAARARTFAELAPRQGRPLRLGILSAELGRHAVGHFLRSWMPALNRQRIQLSLYPTRARREPQAALFQSLADAWIPLDGLSDAEAAERIRADCIDLLIETSGHTQGNRLRIPAYRAAPIQCTWIGYWSTTGLTEMDWFIADPVLAPPEVAPHFRERIWRLDRPWMAYAPLEDAPEPAWRPDPEGRLWLGSFNDFNKLGEPCLRLWARLLRALPEARLLLKHRKAQDRTAQARIRSTLSALGVAPARVEFLDRVASWRDHMALYDRVDLALDTIPYNSGSTGFDALWMGVPLVAIAGDWVGGRMMAAMLAGFGQTDWIARDEDDYVAKVVALARNVDLRRSLRATQRARMRASPLCDGAGLARALEAACEAMFDRWWTERNTLTARPPASPQGTLDHPRLAAARRLRQRPPAASRDDERSVFLDRYRAGRFAEAERIARRLTLAAPRDPAAWHALGAALTAAGHNQEALTVLQRALALAPEDPDTLNSLGNAFRNIGRHEMALTCYGRVLELQPDYASAHYNLGLLLQDLRRLDEAEARYRDALRLKPDLVEAHYNLGNILLDRARPDAAERCYRQALRHAPDSRAAYSNLLLMLAYTRARDPQAMLAEARGWEIAVLTEEERLAARQRQFAPLPRQGRRLRLGVLSAELGQHAVAYFLKPWMQALDRERIALLLYPTHEREDAHAAVFRALADAWTPLAGMTDAEAAARIRADHIDVLIETSGHTAGNRLGIVAHRAAPVQCHYIGYWSTTGLTEMDWFIADPVLAPPEVAPHFRERIWRLDRPWMAYAPLEDAPNSDWQPDPQGTLWLASFNNLAKIRDDCLALWARLLHALPEARLLLKNRFAADPASQTRIQARLGHAAGIDPARVSFVDWASSWRDHMALYDRVDLALDTIPYNSGSTGFDALWMGVPLVAIAGDWVGGRMMAAMLAGFGQTDWIARDEDDYVAKVVALARNVDLRRSLRATQRARMRASPLCDGAGLARALETACEAMFDCWWAERRGAPPRDPATAHAELLARFGERRLDEALVIARRLVTQDPRDGFGWRALGVILMERGQAAEAVPALEQALRLDAEDVESLNSLGNALHALGRSEAALDCLRQAARIRPEFAAAHSNLGAVLQELGRLDDAVASFGQALALQPELPEAHNNLGNALRVLGRFDAALEHYRHALRLRPDFADALNNLGILWRDLGHPKEAAACCRQALALEPRAAETEVNLGNALVELGRIDEAIGCFERARTQQPGLIAASNNLANALGDLGRTDAALAVSEQALAMHPESAEARSNHLVLRAYHRLGAPALQLEAARAWEQTTVPPEVRAAARARTFACLPHHDRPLRIGVLSAELGQHPVAYFLLPWMRALNRDRYRLFLYPTRPRPEPQGAAFRTLADGWTLLAGLGDDAAAARIRADGIDVLIDTSGHTAGNRLGIVARRAAPVQCHYIGYWCTTGLTEMDYFIADPVLAPPALDADFTERVWRLDRPWMAYAPLEDAPEPDWRPDPQGTIWLGSFNNMAKIRDDCLTLWARLLHALPEARLLLKDRKTEEPRVRSRVLETLAHAGVAAERVDFLGRQAAWRDHMALYDRLDIALDTIPYNSGSTGFEALWMGVPLAAIAGNWVGGRMMAAMLAGFGQTDWIARDADDYVARVVALARDVELRRSSRATQRERMRASPLCDGAGLARALEAAWERMFDDRRDRQPASVER